MLKKAEGIVINKNGQTSDTVNIGYTRHRTKAKKKQQTNKSEEHNTTQKTKKMRNTDTTNKKPG